MKSLEVSPGVKVNVTGSNIKSLGSVVGRGGDGRRRGGEGTGGGEEGRGREERRGGDGRRGGEGMGGEEGRGREERRGGDGKRGGEGSCAVQDSRTIQVQCTDHLQSGWWMQLRHRKGRMHCCLHAMTRMETMPIDSLTE